MTPNPHAQRRSLYTAKTVTTSASAIAAARHAEAEEWGTMDQAPARVAAPAGNSMFDWGIVIALVGLFGTFTLMGGGTILAALAVVLLNADSGVAAANVRGRHAGPGRAHAGRGRGDRRSSGGRQGCAPGSVEEAQLREEQAPQAHSCPQGPRRVRSARPSRRRTRTSRP